MNQKDDDVYYIVKDENTLGYLTQENLMGVLSSNKDGHHPNGGPVSIFGAEIREATREDFIAFRVAVPPEFEPNITIVDAGSGIFP